MPFQIVRDNIINCKTDAIVNTANPHVTIGAGVESTIYDAAGAAQLFAERMRVGEIKPGQAFVTPGLQLKASYIIHTVGPIWQGGTSGESDLLHQCYQHCLDLAKEYQCNSIAFPLISSGTYGFPKDKALQIAMNEISEFLLQNDMMIYLVVFDQESFSFSGKLFDGIEQFIDEHYVEEHLNAEYSCAYYSPEEDFKEQTKKVKKTRLSERIQHRIQADSVFLTRRHEECDDALEDIEEEVIYREDMPKRTKKEPHEKSTSICAPSKSLDDVMNQISDSFQQRLLRLIDERQYNDVEVYKRANLDRKLFSKIRCNADYKPKKKTALALAIALELSLDETKDLLARAELALSPSSKFDLIIQYFIENEVYDIYTINVALFQHDQALLGE